ncbi:MAG: hypothetical protein LBK52_00120, partial [Deltaproteobacteria bacterium]|nr:hypothetical protein [Deltaproteobacteria bacterium]
MIPWPENCPLQRPLAGQSGVGSVRLAALAKYGFRNSLDLLLTPPAAYWDRREVTSLAEAEDQKEMVFIGRVIRTSQGISAKNTPWFRAVVADGDYSAVLWWFHQIPYFSRLAAAGRTLVIYGRIIFNTNHNGQPSLTHPEICPAEEALEDFLGVKPAYRIYQGVPFSVFKRLMAQALTDLGSSPPVLPPEWTAEIKLPDPLELLAIIHQPPSKPGPLPKPRESRAFHRLVTYEMMFWRLLILSEKARRQDKAFSRQNRLDLAAGEKFLALLPYEPTSEQRRTAAEFAADLASDKPMNRLLQGEVGSGKTVVAGYVISLVLAQGRQAALAAPTDL